MTEISRFYGIVVMMYAKDHTPPHFHARYGEYEGMFSIETTEMIQGDMPNKPKRLIQARAEIHRDELQKNYEQSTSDNPHFIHIQPLQ